MTFCTGESHCFYQHIPIKMKDFLFKHDLNLFSFLLIETKPCQHILCKKKKKKYKAFHSKVGILNNNTLVLFKSKSFIVLRHTGPNPSLRLCSCNLSPQYKHYSDYNQYIWTDKRPSHNDVGINKLYITNVFIFWPCDKQMSLHRTKGKLKKMTVTKVLSSEKRCLVKCKH